MRKWLSLALVAVLVQGCGGGGGGGATDTSASAPASCSVADQRASLRQFMQTNYYWYRNMPAPDESATTMDAYFQSMLYRPLDRYSYTESSTAYSQIFTTGDRIGYGYTMVWTDATQSTLRVQSVEPLSPVAQAGLQRGDTIVSIDGFTATDIANGKAGSVSSVGVPRTIVATSTAGVRKTITVLSADFPLKPVATTAVFTVQGSAGPEQVGYLDYRQFVSYSESDLEYAFAQFAAAGIGDLIVDLRYNGGGSVAVARDLASMVSGPPLVGKVFVQMRFNDQQSSNNSNTLFTQQSALDGTPLPAAGLHRLFVLTSGGTASASELVINGLRAFLPVILVGDTTYGKPYGFIPRDACGINYEAVQFESFNALGVGGYTSGIQPDCQVADDLNHQLGDPQEARTQVALNYIATGSCGPAAKRQILQQVPRLPPLGETVRPGMFLQ